MAYKLQLPRMSGIHLVFHISRLKRKLGQSDNLIQEDQIVELIDTQSLPHVLERILDTKEKRTRNTIYKECLVKWKVCAEESSTWERVSIIHRRFPTFNIQPSNHVFEDEIFF